MEHTPWTYHIGEDYFTIYNSRDVEVLTSPCLPDADAPRVESIVQAVNSHDELVAALRENLDWMEDHGFVPPSVDRGEAALGNTTKEGK